MTLEQTNKALEEIRKYEDLKKFRDEKSLSFCVAHNINGMQLNFLISVVASERIKEKGVL